MAQKRYIITGRIDIKVLEEKEQRPPGNLENIDRGIIMGDREREFCRDDEADYSYASVSQNKDAWKRRLADRVESDPNLKTGQTFIFPRTTGAREDL